MKYDIQLTHKIDVTDAQTRSLLHKASNLFLIVGGVLLVYLQVSQPTYKKSPGMPLNLGP